MEADEFWALVDEAHEAADGDLSRQAELLTAALARRAPADIVSFDAQFHRTIAQGYSFDLWAVGYLAAGGMSDDEFVDFRAMLVGMGQAVWDRAARDPDSLADVLDDDPDDAIGDAEGLGHAATEAYRQSTGSKMPTPDGADGGGPDDDQDDGPDDGSDDVTAAPSGLPWDENDPADLEKRVPQSWARWGRGGSSDRHAEDTGVDDGAGADSTDDTAASPHPGPSRS